LAATGVTAPVVICSAPSPDLERNTEMNDSGRREQGSDAGQTRGAGERNKRVMLAYPAAEKQIGRQD
jgi:hypothetical protein